MFPNVLQKPVGAVAMLAAAIGGPYAAFETDAGAVVRRVITGVSQSQPNPTQEDPASLSFLNQSFDQSATSPYFGAPSSSQNMPSTQQGVVASSSYGYGGQQSYAQQSFPQHPQPYQQQPPQTGYPQQPQVVYGPATITPIGPNGQVLGYPQPYQAPNQVPNSGHANNGYANLETRQGPATLIPGDTSQLWDYTIGVPSLQQLQRQPTTVGGGNVQDLREVLRFDVTPLWLTQRFSRVTTVLANVQLDGMRVPLITGTQPTDLAGTLTYYFDSRQSVRRINLHGLTGDPSLLANLMVQFYGLKPEQSLGGQLYTSRWNNQVNSVLHISPAPIVYSGADHSKFIVFLELNQADSHMGLSQEASEILNNLRSIRRW
jgi:hypothetical protein